MSIYFLQCFQILSALSVIKSTTFCKLIGAFSFGVACSVSSASTPAVELIQGLIDQTRGLSSVSELAMTIKRPTWERTLEFSVWTRGREDALIRFTAPAKDAGNATLKLGEDMWTYSPKIRRSIRLPKSMMSQDWAGSDFSYNDLARSDKLLTYYDHAIVKETEEDGVIVYTIDSTPKPNSPVVWGLERIVVRSDNVLLSQEYFDQAMKLVKSMNASEIKEFGGRKVTSRMRMTTVGEEDSWTEVMYKSLDFGVEIDDRLFTQFGLRGSG